MDGPALVARPVRLHAVPTDGPLITLGNGSRWQPAAELRTLAAGGQNGDELVVCSGRLVNARAGEMALATKLG